MRSNRIIYYYLLYHSAFGQLTLELFADACRCHRSAVNRIKLHSNVSAHARNKVNKNCIHIRTHAKIKTRIKHPRHAPADKCVVRDQIRFAPLLTTKKNRQPRVANASIISTPLTTMNYALMQFLRSDAKVCVGE